MNLLSIVAALSISVASHASDVTLKSKNLDSQKNDAGTTNFYFTSEKLLIENQFKDDNNALIFDSSKKEFIFIDHAKKEFYQVTEAELQQFIGQLRQMIPMMKAFMGNLPPSQQEKLKKQFGSLLGGEEVETTFSKTDSNVKVKNWSVDKYEAAQGDNKIADMFLASYSNLGVQKDDFKSFDAMRRVFGEIIGEFAGVLPMGPSVAGLASNLDENPAFDRGIPVRSVTYKNGALAGENIMESITKGSISSEKFATPKGYMRKQMEMPKMR